MLKLVKKRSQKTGLPPGTLVHIGDSSSVPVTIELFSFNDETFQEEIFTSFSECIHALRKNTVNWINIIGLHDIDIIRSVGNHFALHTLLLEDILNTDQRPKVEDYEHHLFVALKMLRFIDSDIDIEHVSLILGKNTVISFQERPGDVFDAIRERIRTAKGRIRKSGADFLAYALIDTIVDNYFSILERLSDTIERLDDTIIEAPATDTMKQLSRIKRDLIYIRKSIWPLREIVNALGKSESPLIEKSTEPYLRDVYDHTIQVIDTLETFREMLNSMHDTYLSGISNRMNEIMKVLTIISTIFIPLSFLAGLYGMNFTYMPELDWRWSYFILLGFMGAVGGTMLMYFRSKKWL